MRKKLSKKEIQAFDKEFPEARADVKAMMAYGRGERPDPRLTISYMPYPPKPEEMRRVRHQLKMSQAQMATLLCTPKKTYQNWEQGLRVPMGSVAMLFRLLSKKPALAKEFMAA